MSDHPRGLYKGRASNVGEPTVENAILDAYTKGVAAKREEGLIPPEGEELPEDAPTFRYRVEAIYVEGRNPPTDYVVYLSSGG